MPAKVQPPFERETDVTDLIESRLDEMAAKIAALEEEMATVKKHARVTRKQVRKVTPSKKKDAAAG